MTQSSKPNKLTLEELERISLMGMGGNSFNNICNIARQLADTMRENERLRETLGCISRMRTMPDHKANTFTLAMAHKLADDVLQPNKDSDVAEKKIPLEGYQTPDGQCVVTRWGHPSKTTDAQ